MEKYTNTDQLIARLKVSPLFLGDDFKRNGVIDLIERQPAADVIEAKHGHWEKDTSKIRDDGQIYDYRCSICKGEAHEGAYGNNDVLAEFCHHCGTQMDEEKEERKGRETKASCRECIHYDPCYEFGNILDPLHGGVICDSFKPAADVIELKHGHWDKRYSEEDGYEHSYCSACGTEALCEHEYASDYDEGLDGEYHYCGEREVGIREYITNCCPNCGTQMDEEKGEGAE